MGYLIKFVSVVSAVLLWHLYHLNPDLAQLKDVLHLLHSETVHGHIAVGFILLLIMDDGIGASVSYVSHNRSLRAARNDSRFGGFSVKESKTPD